MNNSKSGVKWYHIAIIGALGAATSYMLLKDRLGGLPAAATGAAATSFVALAFRPGGWFRSDA